MIKQMEVELSLDGLDFPVDKKDLIKYAKDRGASGEVLNGLRGLPDQEYSDIAEVSSQLQMEADSMDKEEDVDEE